MLSNPVGNVPAQINDGGCMITLRDCNQWWISEFNSCPTRQAPTLRWVSPSFRYHFFPTKPIPSCSLSPFLAPLIGRSHSSSSKCSWEVKSDIMEGKWDATAGHPDHPGHPGLPSHPGPICQPSALGLVINNSVLEFSSLTDWIIRCLIGLRMIILWIDSVNAVDFLITMWYIYLDLYAMCKNYHDTILKIICQIYKPAKIVTLIAIVCCCFG